MHGPAFLPPIVGLVPSRLDPDTTPEASHITNSDPSETVFVSHPLVPLGYTVLRHQSEPLPQSSSSSAAYCVSGPPRILAITARSVRQIEGPDSKIISGIGYE